MGKPVSQKGMASGDYPKIGSTSRERLSWGRGFNLPRLKLRMIEAKTRRAGIPFATVSHAFSLLELGEEERLRREMIGARKKRG